MKITDMLKDDPPERRLSKTEISAALRGAETLGYLLITEANAVELPYRQKMKEQGRAAIMVQKNDRYCSLSASLPAGGLLLTDQARNLIADHLIAASLPGGFVIVSNQRIVASRLGFQFAMEFATWLRAFVEDERNLARGQAREHAKVEAEKNADGSIHYKQKGITRLSLKEMAAGA
jgi:hypothetical protein